MPESSLMRNIGIGARTALIIFALIEGCLTAWLITKYNDQDSYPSHSVRDRLRFLCFTSWWTVVFSSIFLASSFGRFLGVLDSIASHGIYVFITWLFWLAGVASYTAAIGGGIRCGAHHITYCHQLVATEAFGWLAWITISLGLIATIFIAARAMRGGDRLSAPIDEV